MPILIVVPYQSSFQWSLALEVACNLRSNGEEVHILDIQISNVRSAKSILRRLAGHQFLKAKVIEKLTDMGISYSCYRKTSFFHWSPSIFGRDGRLNLADRFVRICAANVADTLRTSKIDRGIKVRREFWRQILEAKKVEEILKDFNKKDIRKYDSVYTVNGRYTRNRMVREFYKDLGREVTIIEVGSGQSFTLWSNAQSMNELADKSLAMWNSCADPNKERNSVTYMKGRLSLIGGDNATFKQNMSYGSIPNLPKNKKICTFYSTSQIEFLYLSDRIPSEDYQSQQEAVVDLLETLGPDWHVVVRRHPFGNGNKFGDDEGELWMPLQVYENISFIQPDERVDSYALAKKSNLAAHFGSSIGADLIFMNATPVISMGPTEWEYAEIDTKVRNHSQLMRFLTSPLKTRDFKSILPWAHFYKNRGVKFKYVVKDVNGDLSLRSELPKSTHKEIINSRMPE